MGVTPGIKRSYIFLEWPELRRLDRRNKQRRSLYAVFGYKIDPSRRLALAWKE
jgi:hypothetical protein